MDFWNLLYFLNSISVFMCSGSYSANSILDKGNRIKTSLVHSSLRLLPTSTSLKSPLQLSSLLWINSSCLSLMNTPTLISLRCSVILWQGSWLQLAFSYVSWAPCHSYTKWIPTIGPLFITVIFSFLLLLEKK
jgi:hypothetical protein